MVEVLMRDYLNKIKECKDMGIGRLLFQNVNHGQIILKNTLWLGLGQGLTGMLNFLIIMFVIRNLGVTQYGKFAYALSFVLIFSTLFDFGLATTVTRDFSRDQEKERHFLDLLVLKTILGSIISVFIMTLAIFTIADIDIRKCIIILAFYIFSMELTNLFYAFFRARQRMEIEATFRCVHVLLQAVVVLFLIYMGLTVVTLSVAYVGAMLIILICISLYFFWKIKVAIPYKLSLNKLVWKEFLAIGIFIALSKGVGDVTLYSDSLMLGQFGRIEDVGLYNAITRINGMILFPMALITSAIYPTLIAVLKESKEKFVKYWETWVKIAIFFSVLLCFMTIAKADQIILLLYSKQFLPAASALKIVVFVAAIVWILSAYYHLLLIFDQQKGILRAFMIGMVVSLGLNFVLIPRIGLYGAAITAVLANAVIFGQYLYLTGRHTFVKPFSKTILIALTVSLTSGGAMYLFLISMPVNLWLSIICGTIIYGVSFLFIQKFSPEIYRTILSYTSKSKVVTGGVLK